MFGLDAEKLNIKKGEEYEITTKGEDGTNTEVIKGKDVIKKVGEIVKNKGGVSSGQQVEDVVKKEWGLGHTNKKLRQRKDIGEAVNEVIDNK